VNIYTSILIGLLVATICTLLDIDWPGWVAAVLVFGTINAIITYYLMGGKL